MEMEFCVDEENSWQLRRLLRESQLAIGAEAALLWVLHESCSGQKELVSSINTVGRDFRISYNDDDSNVAKAAQTDQPVFATETEGLLDGTIDSNTSRPANTLCVPVRQQSGDRVIGVMQIANKTSNPRSAVKVEGKSCDITSEDLQFLFTFAAQAAALLSRALPGNDGVNKKEDHNLMTGDNVVAGDSERLRSDAQNQGRQHAAVDEDQKFRHPPRRVAKCFDKWRDCFSANSATTPTDGDAERSGSISSSNSDRVELELLLDTPAVSSFLDRAWDSWQADTMGLSALTGERPLSTLAVYLFERHGLCDHFKIDRPRLVRYMELIEEGYPVRNPYHNRCHAASVLHVTHALLHSGKVENAIQAGDCVDGKLAVMAALIAAVIHDYEHPGLTNDFLVRTSDWRAVRYNDQHVNENHSIAAAFELLTTPGHEFLEFLPAAEYRILRGMVINIVLGTDMAEGNRILATLIGAAGPANSADNSGDRCEAPNGFIPRDSEAVTMVLQAVVKCADFSHISLDWDLHLKWVRCLEEEFFQQGDLEKDAGWSKISFMMDRNKPGASATQVGFLDFVVLPLFRAMVALAPASKPMLDTVETNYELWKAIQVSKDKEKEKTSHPPCNSVSTTLTTVEPSDFESNSSLPQALESSSSGGLGVGSLVTPFTSDGPPAAVPETSLPRKVTQTGLGGTEKRREAPRRLDHWIFRSLTRRDEEPLFLPSLLTHQPARAPKPHQAAGEGEGEGEGNSPAGTQCPNPVVPTSNSRRLSFSLSNYWRASK